MLGDNSLCVLNSCVETLPFGTPCVGSVRSPSSSILPGKGGVEATTTKLASLSALLSSYAQHTSKMHLAHPFSPALGKANVGGRRGGGRGHNSKRRQRTAEEQGGGGGEGPSCVRGKHGVRSSVPPCITLPSQVPCICVRRWRRHVGRKGVLVGHSDIRRKQ